MKLIVGLGNPGAQYEKTKHNIGFMAINNFAAENNLSLTKAKFDGQYEKTKIDGEDVLLLKPLTFMNDSGRSVGPMAAFFGVNPEDIMVIQDDMDLPMGKIRLKKGGSSGGHNGIKSLIAHLGTDQFVRLKIGIKHPDRQKVVDWVLTPFTKSDQALIDQAIDTSDAIIKDFIDGQSLDKLMNKYN